MLDLEFPYSEQQRKLFKSGKLITTWSKKYPVLFDRQDTKLARNQAPYHFYEWLGAILLYEATGYYSLVEKWDCISHLRKHSLFADVAGKRVFSKIMGDSSGYPDLLVYSPDKKDWFFCEVKGPDDRISKVQMRRFRMIKKMTGKDVLLIRFNAI